MKPVFAIRVRAAHKWRSNLGECFGTAAKSCARTVILAVVSSMTFAGAAIGNAATLEAGPMMSVPRMGHYIVPMPGGAVALLGGHGTGFVALNSMDLWTPTNNTFTGASIPFVYDGGALVPISDGTYLMAGGAANLGIAPGYASAQILYPSNATVTSTGTSMVYPRMRCQGAQLTGGNVLIVGGWNDAASTTYGEVFTPSNNAFASTGPLNNPRSLPLVFPTSDGQAVVVGGTSIYGDSDISSVELYNPSSNAFTVLAPFVIPSETAWVYAALGYGQDIEHCKTSDGRYVFMMSQNGGTDYALAFFDPVSKQFSKLALTPAFLDQPGRLAASRGPDQQPRVDVGRSQPERGCQRHFPSVSGRLGNRPDARPFRSADDFQLLSRQRGHDPLARRPAVCHRRQLQHGLRLQFRSGAEHFLSQRDLPAVPDPPARPFRRELLLLHSRHDRWHLPDSIHFQPRRQPVANGGKRHLDQFNPALVRPGDSHQFHPLLPINPDKSVMKSGQLPSTSTGQASLLLSGSFLRRLTNFSPVVHCRAQAGFVAKGGILV